MISKPKFENRDDVVRVLHQVTELGIIGVLFLAPMVMAGRFDPGRLMLSCLVGLTTLAWVVARILAPTKSPYWCWTGTEWIAAAAILLVTLQVLPLSRGMLTTLSPTADDLLPMYLPTSDSMEAQTGDGLFGVWNTISLAPHATRGGLAMAMVYAMFFFVVVHYAKSRQRIEKLLKLVAMAGVSMAAIGLAQYLFGNGKFLWMMEHPSRDTLTAVKGTFANENHFAHFLALCLGPLLWWLVKESSARASKPNSYAFGAAKSNPSASKQQVLLCGGLGVVVLAALLTYSRGGLTVMMIAAIATTGWFLHQQRVGRRAVLAVAVIGVVSLIAVWIHGQDILLREIGSLQQISMDSFDQDQGRRRIWSAVLRAVPDFIMLGSGVGSHRYIYPTYFPGESSVHYTHAESGFLHVLLETGLAGSLVLLVAIGLSGYWIVRSLLSSGDKNNVAFLAVPLFSSWLASLVHAVFDFNWFIPANMCLTLVVLALATRLSGLAGDGRVHAQCAVSKLSWLSMASITAVAVAFSVHHFIAPARAHTAWNEYRALSLASNRFAAKSIGPGLQRRLGFVDGSDPQVVARMIEQLREAVAQNPNHGRAHIQLAALCLKQFELLQQRSENAMSLAQIRDAAMSAGFTSHQEMTEWVTRVVDENRVLLDRAIWHCKRGLRATPTEGLGYLFLGELAFLDESLNTLEYKLVHQAHCVRPHDPGVQFALGRHKLLLGETEEALVLWKNAFHHGPQVRQRIIAALAYQVSPEEIVEVFQPQLEGLRDLFEYYRQRELTSPLGFVGTTYVTELERQAKLMAGRPAGRLWMDAQFVHATLGNVEEAALAARNAVMSQPGEYDNHFACALRLRDAGRLEEAINEFRWCQARRPEDQTLPRVVVQLQQQLRQARSQNAQLKEDQRLTR